MPRLKETERQRNIRLKLERQRAREDALVEAVRVHAAKLKFTTDKEIADYLGVSPQVYCKRQQKAFQNITVAEFVQMAEMLEFTADEVAGIIGIKTTL